MSDGLEHKGKRSALMQQEVIINGILKAHALDISEEGMYISTQAELLSGAVLDLGFKVGDVPVAVKAVVRHAQPGIGIGVKFINLTPEHYAIIKKFVEHSEEVTAGAGKAGKKILLVDDSAQSRSIYRNKLGLEGFAVTEATNGVEALKQLSEMVPDLVILDLWMEGIDGFKILQLMQLNPNLKNIPVIVLSARTVPADIQKAISLGAREYLPKMSTSPVKLTEKVKEILSKV
jgi:CheY-like chemotaxis protein